MMSNGCAVCGRGMDSAAEICPACGEAQSFFCNHCGNAVSYQAGETCPACRLPIDNVRSVSLAEGKTRWKLREAKAAEGGDAGVFKQRLMEVLSAAEETQQVDPGNAIAALCLREALQHLSRVLLDEAQALIARGTGMAAIASLEQWNALHPDDVLIQMHLAELRARRQSFYDRAAEAQRRGEFAAARAVLAECAEEFSDDAEIQNAAAALEHLEAEVDQLLQQSRVLCGEKRFFALRDQLPGLARLAPGHPEVARLLRATNQAIAAADAQAERARARLLERDPAGAKAAARHAIGLASDHPTAETLVAEAETAEAEAKRLLDQARAAFDAGDDAGTLEQLALARAAGAPAAACRELKNAVEMRQAEQRQAARRRRRRAAVAVAAVVVVALALRAAAVWYAEFSDYRRALAQARQAVAVLDGPAALRAIDRFAARYPESGYLQRLEPLRERAGEALAERGFRDLANALALARDPREELALLDRYLIRGDARAYRQVVEASRAAVLAQLEAQAYDELKHAVTAAGDDLSKIQELYGHFLVRHATNPFATEVQAKLAAIPDLLAGRAWDEAQTRARAADSLARIRIYEEYLRVYGDSPYAERARRALEEERLAYELDELDLALAIIGDASDNPERVNEVVRRYLARFPDGIGAARLREALESLAREEETRDYLALARKRDALDEDYAAIVAACDDYLATYPRGRYRDDVSYWRDQALEAMAAAAHRAMVERVDRATSDEEILRIIAAYLETNPSPARRSDAERLREQVAARPARNALEAIQRRLADPQLNPMNKLALCDSFLANHSDSEVASVVRAMRRDIYDQWEAVLYARVQAAASAPALDYRAVIERGQAYLAMLPDATRADEVRAITRDAQEQQRSRDLTALRDTLRGLGPRDFARRAEAVERFLREHGEAIDAETRAGLSREIDASFEYFLAQAELALAKSEHQAALRYVARALRLKPGDARALEMYDRVPASLRVAPPRVEAKPGTHLDELWRQRDRDRRGL